MPVSPSKPTTIEDIARHLGITKMTVSRALSGKGRISEHTVRQVMLAAEQLNYQPNPHARSLSKGRSDVIGLFVPNLYEGTGLKRTYAMQALLLERGFDVPLHSYGSHWLAQKHRTQLLRNMCLQQPRGMLCQVSPQGLEPEGLSLLRQYLERGGHAVCFTSHVQLECDQVVFDYDDAGYKTARHLIEQGHTAIGYASSSDGAMYHGGFQRALQEHGLDCRPEWSCQVTADRAGGLQLAQAFLAMPRRPSGLVVENDVVAASFAHHVIRAGIRIPQDLAMLAFDDSDIAANCITPLTVLRQPVERIARTVVEMLLQRLGEEYDGPPRVAVIQGDVVARASTVVEELD